MVEVIVVPLLQKLSSLIAEEGSSLFGVGEQVEWLRDELQSMRSLLRDADAGTDGESVKTWLMQLRDAVHDAEDVIDEVVVRKEWMGRPRTFASRIHSYSCFIRHLIARRDVKTRIQGIRQRLEDISRRKSQYEFGRSGMATLNIASDTWKHHLASSPLVQEADMVGVERDVDLLFEWLLEGEAQLMVITLAGMGGVGKTTLVKKVYNDIKVKRHFDRCAWIPVSQTLQITKLFEVMVKGLVETPEELKEMSANQLQEKLHQSLSGKRYLVVLDDVWSIHVWQVVKLVLPIGEQGSRIVITTRNTDVASSPMHGAVSRVHSLHPLNREQSWALFCKRSFGNDLQSFPLELKELGEGMVKACDGLPLAIVTMGGVMSKKATTQVEWKSILDNIQRDMRNHDEGIWHALLLSYNDLPYFLKSCFLYCFVFPQDFEISRKRLVRLWVAEGFIDEMQGDMMEDVAENYFNELISRSLLQVATMGSSRRVKACRVHDLLHKLAISISEKDNFGFVYADPNTKPSQRARRVSIQKNDQNVALNMRVFHRLRSFSVFEVREFSLPNHLSRCLGQLRVLDLQDASIQRLPSDVGELIHLRYLGLMRTGIKKLPGSIRNLHNLLTLDIRKTDLQRLPGGILKLLHLRHLDARQLGRSVCVPSRIGMLSRLHVLTGIEANRTLVQELGKLTQLRKLGLESVRAEHGEDLSTSIEKMGCLSSLAIFASDNVEQLRLEKLSPPLYLQKLHLQGYLGELPNWFGCLRNLTKLRLGLSGLSEDPLLILQALPRLSFLQLYAAYIGKQMICSELGFGKLKILIFTELEELEEWRITEGAMPCIQELWIMSCPRLKMLPESFAFLTTIQKLRLVGMPQEFLKRLNPSQGEDHEKVRRIPTIQIFD